MACICITVTGSVICQNIKTEYSKASLSLKEDLLKLDKITAETRLLGRENISTDEQLFSYKESLKGQIKTLNDDRTHLRKKQEQR